jgi:hypothetical protein
MKLRLCCARCNTVDTCTVMCSSDICERKNKTKASDSSQVPLVAYQHSTRQMAPADGWYSSYSSSGGLTREPRPFVCPSYSDAPAFSMRGQSPAAPALLAWAGRHGGGPCDRGTPERSCSACFRVIGDSRAVKSV